MGIWEMNKLKAQGSKLKRKGIWKVKTSAFQLPSQRYSLKASLPSALMPCAFSPGNQPINPQLNLQQTA